MELIRVYRECEIWRSDFFEQVAIFVPKNHATWWCPETDAHNQINHWLNVWSYKKKLSKTEV